MPQTTTLDKKPKVQIVELKIKAGEPFGPELKKARLSMGFSCAAVARAIDWLPNNLKQFEENGAVGQGIHTAFKYAKAIRIKRLIFTL